MSNALSVISERIGVDIEETKTVLKNMIISAKNQHGSVATDAELAIISSTCAKYDLNPLVKECAAFISGGKMQVVLMIDGWYRIVNRQESFDGVEFQDHLDAQGQLTAITCQMYIKGRSRPVTVTEYLAECRQDKSDVWKKYPARMLRHKAYIQCARMTFGISEMIDEDEAGRIRSGEKDVSPSAPIQAVDYSAIEKAMSLCTTQQELDDLCIDIRADMEKRNLWATEKLILAEMKGRHKLRVAEKPEDSEDFVADQDDKVSATLDSDDEVTFD